MNQYATLLIQNNLLAVPKTAQTVIAPVVGKPALVGTLLSNMAYFGYIPNADALAVIRTLSKDELVSFWKTTEKALKEVSGDNRNMGDFVVYKNFPTEVLSMSEGEYWIKQILMYWGLPNVLFTEEEKARPALFEDRNLKVLALAGEDAPQALYDALVRNASRWSDNQDTWAKTLSASLNKNIVVSEFAFKENAIVLLVNAMDTGLDVGFEIEDATDVLRLCAALSDGDVSLREKVKFKKFKRAQRKRLLLILENTKNLVDDFGLRPEAWKRLLSLLHPGEYDVPKVKEAYDALYKGAYVTFNGRVDAKVKTNDILVALKSRPGEFMRRLHYAYSHFGLEAIEAFVTVIPKLKTSQLLKLRGYVENINGRKKLMYPPKGNWSRVQIADNTKKPFSVAARDSVVGAIGKELKARLKVAFPDGIKLDPATVNIKLQTNDQKLAEYGRGTVFDIPAEMTFLRSASYWKSGETIGNIWYDNGWNFFDENWTNMETCSWNSTYVDGKAGRAAIFSGDPTNSKDLEGRACQMIDLYIDKLAAMGIRYAVWNILCYSEKNFDEAEDVLATLQWGENATTGNLYEPSRAQMVFPLKGKGLVKYVAYVDVVERKLVYMDVDFNGDVSTAARNGDKIAAKMPAFTEYLKSLPSIHDLFANANKGKTPVLFTDEGVKLKNADAYVFRPLNPENTFKQMDISALL